MTTLAPIKNPDPNPVVRPRQSYVRTSATPVEIAENLAGESARPEPRIGVTASPAGDVTATTSAADNAAKGFAVDIAVEWLAFTTAAKASQALPGRAGLA